MTTDGLTYRMLAVGPGLGGAARRRRHQGAPRVARAQPGHLLRRPPGRAAAEGGGVGPLRAELPRHRRPRRRRAARSPSTASASATTPGASATGPGSTSGTGSPGFLTDGRALQPLRGAHATTTPPRSTASCTAPTATTTSWPSTGSCDRADDGGAASYRMTLTTDDRRRPSTSPASGPVPSVPVRPAPDQPAVVHETPMRLDWPTAWPATASTSTSSPSSIDDRRPRRASPTGPATTERPAGGPADGGTRPRRRRRRAASRSRRSPSC